MMLDCKKIFEKITPYRLSREMKIPTSTTYSWRRLNKIPSWRVAAILDACKKLDVDISDCIEQGEA